MDNDNEPKRAPLWCSARLGLTIVGFFGFAILYAQRSNLSVALVCMVNNTAVKAQTFDPRNLTDAEGMRCPARANNKKIDDGDFAWTKQRQGLVLGAFFWGYIVTQLPGVWSHWAPYSERTILVGCAYAGAQIGNVVAMPVSGALCDSIGWETIFYLFGGLSGLWCIIWFIFASDTPAQHKRISETERKYIEQSIHHMDFGRMQRTKKTPWLTIATSLPVWAIVVAHFCAGFGTYLVLTELPTYMNEVLRFDMKSNGLYSAFPYLAFFTVGNIATISSDYLRHHYFSTGTVRKLMMGTALVCQAAFLVATGYLSCEQTGLAVLFLTLSSGLSGFQYGGYLVNHVDIAPRYAGTLMGISNTFGTIDGIIAPYIASAVTSDQSIEQWRLVFWIAAAILLFGAAFYAIFASGDIQRWAFTPSKSGKFTLTYAEQEELEREPLLAE